MIIALLAVVLIFLPLISLLIFTLFEITQLTFLSINMPELLRVLKLSSYQALVSASLSIFVGFFGALGLMSLKKNRNYYKFIFLIPNFLPPLVIILSVISFVEQMQEVGGLSQVVWAHVLINIGLCAVLIENIFSSKNTSFFNLAIIEGASNLRLISLYIRYFALDIFYVFVFITFMCFGSFSIPLILGGMEGKTIEVLIYESVRVEGNFVQGVVLASFEIFIFAVLFFFYKKENIQILKKPVNLPFFKKIFILPPLLCIVFSVWSLGSVLFYINELSFPAQLWDLIPFAFLNSVGISVFVGLLVYFILGLLTYAFEFSGLRRFIYHFDLSSSVLLAFGAYLLKVKLNLNQELALVLAIVAIVFPSLYRARGFKLINSLEAANRTSLVLGANNLLRFKLFFKMNHKSFALLGAVAAFWAFGDFAVSRLVLDTSGTLPLLISDLIKSYRLDLALTLNWVMILGGGLCFLTIIGIDYVFSKINKI